MIWITRGKGPDRNHVALFLGPPRLTRHGNWVRGSSFGAGLDIACQMWGGRSRIAEALGLKAGECKRFVAVKGGRR